MSYVIPQNNLFFGGGDFEKTGYKWEFNEIECLSHIINQLIWTLTDSMIIYLENLAF